jgi:phosphoribosyl-ATP pyrophosphohydrolase / phosphoribosyl-AMP cyclohydrolase / histidinol dehydrogenase
LAFPTSRILCSSSVPPLHHHCRFDLPQRTLASRLRDAPPGS